MSFIIWYRTGTYVTWCGPPGQDKTSRNAHRQEYLLSTPLTQVHAMPSCAMLHGPPVPLQLMGSKGPSSTTRSVVDPLMASNEAAQPDCSSSLMGPGIGTRSCCMAHNLGRANTAGLQKAGQWHHGLAFNQPQHQVQGASVLSSCSESGDRPSFCGAWVLVVAWCAAAWDVWLLAPHMAYDPVCQAQAPNTRILHVAGVVFCKPSCVAFRGALMIRVCCDGCLTCV